MNWRPHFAIGALTAAVLALILHNDIFVIFLASVVGGLSALAPDIDHDSSKIRKAADITVPIFGIFFALSATCYADATCVIDNFRTIIISALAITGLYTIVITYMKPKHRGITHTIVFAGIFFVLLFLISSFQFALFGLAGYASHLLADKHIRLI